MNSRQPERVGRVIFAALLPHAPILIPQIGGEDLKATRASVAAMKTVAVRLNSMQPGAVVIISPHSPRRFGAFGLWSGKRLYGDLRHFGAGDIALDILNGLDLASELKVQARSRGIATWAIPSQPLDHGVLVPLWYLAEAGWHGPTIVISVNYPGQEGLGRLGRLGQALADAISRRSKPVAVIASGDMSHRLTPDAPAGYEPRARDFDSQLIECLRKGAYHDLEHLDLTLRGLAAEDALDSTIIAAASVNWQSTGHAVLSYEGSFGVGYGVAVLFDSEAGSARPLEMECQERCRAVWADTLPNVARESLKATLFETSEATPPIPDDFLAMRRGVFVSIRRPNGQLRGCIGTFLPECENVVEETRHLTYLASFCDGRFPPVTRDEFHDLRFEVSLVEPPEEVTSEAQLDPINYGIVMRTADGREGCLLPNLAEIHTGQQQLDFARRKGRIHPWEPTRLQRFLAPRFLEKRKPQQGGVMFTPLVQSAYPADWWTMLPDGRIECQLCPRACKLQDGQRGFCFVRQRRHNQLILTTYGRTSGFWVDPVEKKPLNHFYPGTGVLSFGTVGCNLGCRFCQNWDLSNARESDRLGAEATPETIARAAHTLGCKGLAFTYNEPVVFAEYAIDVALACHAVGIQTIAVTAGYINAQPRLEFYHHIDAANVDLKGFTEAFYHKLCLGRLAPVLETLIYLRSQTKVWLEVTSLLIPGENDDEAQLHWAAEWFAEHLGPNVPWHFTAFHPDYKLLEKPPTPTATLDMARRIAVSKGLHYVYTGNIRDPGGNSTWCPQCRRLLIQREGYELGTWNLHASRCAFCSKEIVGKFENHPGSWGPRRMPVELGRIFNEN